MSEPITKFVLVQANESIALSAYRDAVSFGTLCVTAIVVNTAMPPSGWINAAVAICWMMWVFGRGKRLIMTPAQAEEHLRNLAKEQTHV